MTELQIVAIEIPQDQIIDFCRRYQVARLALFGSVLGNSFGPDSDVDVLDSRHSCLSLASIWRLSEAGLSCK